MVRKKKINHKKYIKFIELTSSDLTHKRQYNKLQFSYLPSRTVSDRRRAERLASTVHYLPRQYLCHYNNGTSCIYMKKISVMIEHHRQLHGPYQTITDCKMFTTACYDGRSLLMTIVTNINVNSSTINLAHDIGTWDQQLRFSKRWKLQANFWDRNWWELLENSPPNPAPRVITWTKVRDPSLWCLDQ